MPAARSDAAFWLIRGGLSVGGIAGATLAVAGVVLSLVVLGYAVVVSAAVGRRPTGIEAQRIERSVTIATILELVASFEPTHHRVDQPQRPKDELRHGPDGDRVADVLGNEVEQGPGRHRLRPGEVPDLADGPVVGSQGDQAKSQTSKSPGTLQTEPSTDRLPQSEKLIPTRSHGKQGPNSPMIQSLPPVAN